MWRPDDTTGISTGRKRTRIWIFVKCGFVQTMQTKLPTYRPAARKRPDPHTPPPGRCLADVFGPRVGGAGWTFPILPKGFLGTRRRSRSVVTRTRLRPWARRPWSTTGCRRPPTGSCTRSRCRWTRRCRCGRCSAAAWARTAWNPSPTVRRPAPVPRAAAAAAAAGNDPGAAAAAADRPIRTPTPMAVPCNSDTTVGAPTVRGTSTVLTDQRNGRRKESYSSSLVPSP